MGIKVLGRSEYDRDLVMGGGQHSLLPEDLPDCQG